LDLEKLDSARKRLHENYQEIQNGNNFIDVPSCSFRFYCDEHRAKGVNIEESDSAVNILTCFFVTFLQQKSRGRCRCWISTNYQSQKIKTPSSARAAEVASQDDVDLSDLTNMQIRSHEKVKMKIK
jgi:hypothetical protein